ncbi:glycerol-3-phosphate acyltransferase (plasmid) [Sinorhizobium sp. B11]
MDYDRLRNSPLVAIPPRSELYSLAPWLVCVSGLAVLVGHGCSICIRFSGGKSTARGLGALSPFHCDRSYARARAFMLCS